MRELSAWRLGLGYEFEPDKLSLQINGRVEVRQVISIPAMAAGRLRLAVRRAPRAFRGLGIENNEKQSMEVKGGTGEP
jgi:hypothetical protein